MLSHSVAAVAALALASTVASSPLLAARNVDFNEPSCSSFTPFNYVGCFPEASSGRALPYSYGSGLLYQNMTVEFCQSICKGNGFQYAGLEYYGQCFCGASINTAIAASSNCDYACYGNANENCGGNSFLSVYKDPTFPALPAIAKLVADYQSVGCYAEEEPYRALAFQQTQLNQSQMTVEYCLNTCGSLGYAYAGVEYGQECWCSTDIASSAIAQPSSACTSPCAGNANEICGGSQLINIYYNSGLVSTSPCGYIIPPLISSSSSSTTTTTTTTTTVVPVSTTTTPTTSTTTTAPATSSKCTTGTTMTTTTKPTSSTTTTTTALTCTATGAAYTGLANPFTQLLPWYPSFQSTYFNPIISPPVAKKFTGVTTPATGGTTFTCANPLWPSNIYGLSNVVLSQTAIKYNAYLMLPATATYNIQFSRCLGACYMWVGSKAVSGWSEYNYDSRSYLGNLWPNSVQVNLMAGQQVPITFLYGSGIIPAGMQVSIQMAYGGAWTDISTFLFQPSCGSDTWA